MMEVEHAAGGGADLLMECDEEEQEIWPPSPETHGEEDQGLEAVVSPMEQETDPPPVRIIPIPVQPVSSCSPSTVKHSVKPSGGPLGFMVNGRVVPLLPGGGGVELKLHSHPKGSASGFTTVQIPVTVTVHSPAGTHHINTTASLTAAITPNPAATAPPEPEAGPTPIITGVVSGEAAQKVLSDHNVNFKSSPPLLDLKTPPTLPLNSRRTTPPASQRTKPPPSSSRPAAPHKLLRKGQLGPVSPPDCLICVSQYKLITELRGFMCLCSPAIAQSLKNLKKKSKSRRKSRDKTRTCRSSRDPQNSSKVSRTKSEPGPGPGPQPPARSDDFLSDQFTNPAPPSSISSPQQDHSEPAPDPPHGKLVILVEDFYYGSAPGRSSIKPNLLGRKFTGPYHCIHCPQTLRNNIELMSHMQQHVSTMSQEDGGLDSVSSCPHCFRHFLSPFKLQCHLETVHSQYESTATCRICELEFGSEPAFLWHMKNTHKPGEMPYVCQVCDFRSSFYSDVWSHFQETHADTKHLLCQYCLRVLRSNTCYQQHFARHQKKHVFGCEKCRLHFLYVKERMEHKLLHHKTHIRPSQLTGLKPGTKVTVRTYSVVGGPENEEAVKKAVVPCKVVDVDPPPPPQEAPKRKVESLGPLLSSLSEEVSVSHPRQRCVECLGVIQDFRTHFPSLVHCSLCRFITCCSTSYANHMINNHATCRKNLQYQSIFQSDSRLSERLRCGSCPLSTCRGDVMANHLTERPEHYCKTQPGRSVGAAQPTHNSRSVTSPDGQGRGAFVPIHLLPSGQTSTQLSVKLLTSPSPLSSPPAMTIKFLGPRPEQPLTLSQLPAVLSSLCHGLPQAARLHHTSPQVIRSWTRQQERGLWNRKWSWWMEKLMEQVLSQREQQLVVSEESLLQEAAGALGEDSLLVDHYTWTIDFLLRHDLSLQTSSSTTSTNRVMLPRNMRRTIHSFIRSLCSQIQTTGLPPHCLGSMDEFSIFIRSDEFRTQDPSSLQLCGSPEDPPVFDVVLSALSDGTLLTPLLFFRGTPSHVPEGFPDNVLLEAREEGFPDQDRLQIWINKVWRPRVAVSGCDRRSVLMVDIHRGHLSNRFRAALGSASTDALVIPSGCSCRLQPLDVCVTPVLRDFLQARWTQLVSQGGLDGLGLGQLALTLACWLSEVSSTLNSETSILHRSFSSVCDLQQVEDRQEAARMIRALTEALIQPLEEPGPGPELELLVVMEEGKQEEKIESREEVEQEDNEELFDGDQDD
ncbi:pogo transposable element with ZNF domain [Trachinotus anak]|uniref:pogo transposable element with ZNF domain n=1 Tax=Trachinotus anak TaxID=443729 RepID=UPI0039F20C35